ncbi:hypothetical protein EJ110_NYTH30552 [Nymphaea thermarum]|nr:hypothetical protein EJ110_NYTH30552 [Nymphaea thermarum]
MGSDLVWFFGLDYGKIEKMGGDTSTYTVDDALLVLGFGKFQVLMLAYAGMGWISEAMEVMLLSFVGPAVQLEWGLSSHQESMITSVVFAGMLLVESDHAHVERVIRPIGGTCTAVFQIMKKADAAGDGCLTLLLVNNI